MTIIQILFLCVMVAGCLFGLYLASKGVISLFHRNIKSGLAYIIVGIPLFLILAALILLPVVTCDLGPHPRTPCMQNLSEISKACVMYSMDHNEHFPDDLSQLTPIYLKNTNAFFCPSGRNANGSLMQYVLVENLSETNSSSLILVHCPLGSHKGKGGNVLFVDGSTSWYMSQYENRYETNQSQSFEEIVRKGRE